MDCELKEQIERLIVAHCFSRDGEQIEGADFAAEAIAKLFEKEREEDYRSIVLDMTTRDQ